ncbi:MAG: AAA family ATPase [Deltaproteobacteria bacterium]|jgi:hypothetical protein|nr:AAA family ATPase [Deltaproteobacteria bacterium]
MEQKTPLPLGDPTFREIIQSKSLYADKTVYIHSMINGPKSRFLSRPRRFGKTLLVDTIEELFLGNRELFKSLWIDLHSDYKFVRHPVLRLNMAYPGLSTKQDLVSEIEWTLRRTAKKDNVDISAISYTGMLEELLDGMSQKYGVGVVVLIDEYDAPVSWNISNIQLASDNSNVLHGFYTSIMRNLRFVRFAFVTCITRFTWTALDSGPNNFMDISLVPEFAGICGFTVSEFESLFAAIFNENTVKGTLKRLKDDGRIGNDADEAELKAMILKWYGGYNWLGPEHILNPYSTLHFFMTKEFDDYWTMLGVPSHLSVIVRDNPQEFFQPDLKSYTAHHIKKSGIGELAVDPVLFHSGYLTIGGEFINDEVIDGEPVKVCGYTLRIPNLEIAKSYCTSIFKSAFDPKLQYFSNFSKYLPLALSDRNSNELTRLLGYLLSSISHFRQESSESYYSSIINTAFIAAGISVISETPGANVRSDMTVSPKDSCNVAIELKYTHAIMAEDDSCPAAQSLAAKDHAAALDKATRQFMRRKYGDSLRTVNTNVICLAISIRGRTQVATRFVDPESPVG